MTDVSYEPIRIFYFSGCQLLTIENISSLIGFFISKNLGKPDVAVFSELTLETSAESLEKVQVNLSNLCRILELERDRIMIIPSPRDLEKGEKNFSDTFYEPFMGKPFLESDPRIINLVPHMQLVYLDTLNCPVGVSKTQLKERLIDAELATREFDPSSTFVRVLLSYHHFWSWEDPPVELLTSAAHEQRVRFSMASSKGSLITRDRDIFLIGTISGCFTYLSYYPYSQLANALTAYMTEEGPCVWKENQARSFPVLPMTW